MRTAPAVRPAARASPPIHSPGKAPDELRLYVGANGPGSSIQKPTEIILNAAGAANTRDLTGEPELRMPLKNKAEGAEWTLLQRDQPAVFEVRRSGAVTVTSTQDPQNFPDEKDNASAADDGFFVTGPDFTTYEFSFFSFATQRWKRSLVSAQLAAPLRYNGNTYVVGFESRYAPAPPEILVWKDTGAAMQLMWKVTLSSQALLITNATVFGKYAIVAATTGVSAEKYSVFKIDLESFAVQLVQEQVATKPYGNTPRFAEYNVQEAETDDAGNLYAVENRVENQNARYSIRKYSASGGSEVVLKESDLKENCGIQGLRYFNGKLHAAVSYREMVSAGTSKWHLQMIRLK